MTPLLQRRWVPVAVFAFGALMLVAALWASLLDQPGGTAGSGVADVGGPFRLVNQDGRSVTEADFRGAPSLMFFGYTHCPDVCPTTLFELTQVLAKLGASRKVNVIFTTVDPERDTPQVMKDYLSSFDPRFTGLTGDRASVDAMLKAYRVYSRKIPGQNGEYSMDHLALVYLMDKQGRFISTFNLDGTPEESAAKLAGYL